MFVGALAYADDITLLAPTPAFRKSLAVCESIGTNHMLKFNPDKTQCIRFSWKSSGCCSSVFMFCGKYIVCVKSVLHLSHVLPENLQDDLNIQRCHSDFIKRANCMRTTSICFLYPCGKHVQDCQQMSKASQNVPKCPAACVL